MPVSDDMSDMMNSQPNKDHDDDDTRKLDPIFEEERALGEDKRLLLERLIETFQSSPNTPVSSQAIMVRPTEEEPPVLELRKSEEIKIEAPAPSNPPWTLQQFFDGEIDLDIELASRFQRMPVMSVISFRGLGTKDGRGVATITTQDNSAQVIFEADASTRTVQMAFTYGSMLTLRFALRELSEIDRERWLELMQREQGGLAFLWGPSRWESDYLICIARQYYTNLYAFSPNNFEAAIRMTPEVMKKLLRWLEKFWEDDDRPNEASPPLLTW
ncbi:MAG: hypothetical protein H7Y09_07770 [Chitinophagaceae bacterium]|nr:hypothetical protein [Anaerolineae bacterium]